MGEFINPNNWIDLLTLITLEIFLGMDNLFLIAIFSNRLPLMERNQARIIGMGIALIMRFILLSIISWSLNLDESLFVNIHFSFSVHDLILMIGGVFLIFESLIELYDRFKINTCKCFTESSSNDQPNFWNIILKIVILDTIFSVDSVIAAVSISNNLVIMITAAFFAMGVMFLAFGFLTNILHTYPKIVILCLEFLLMLGFLLLAESLGYKIPRKYLYISVIFIILIKTLNKLIRSNINGIAYNFFSLNTIYIITKNIFKIEKSDSSLVKQIRNRNTN